MKVFTVFLTLAIVGISAAPENYFVSQQNWHHQKPERTQELSPDGYKIVPGTIDVRCPRTDDINNPIHLPIQGDCSKFMKCFGGRAFEQECPGGLEFGVAVNRCDYPDLAKCSRN
ncbi:uncharacterized protein LOC134215236 [Armigeres subalbatus]|uniref:uncharacterized protein LOC134215236 n=1 Tax=Armigeres subalbatus TaxID=124917 RepID=UPI002ED3B961